MLFPRLLRPVLSAIVKVESDWRLMGLKTVEQVRRVFRVVAGFTLLDAGVVMLITAGSRWLVDFPGIGTARRGICVGDAAVMERIKREAAGSKTILESRKSESTETEKPKSSQEEPPLATEELLEMEPL